MDEPPVTDELVPPDRTLLGPGPSNVHPRVRRAMTTPMLGYLDPPFVEIMSDVTELLRYVFQTENRWTFPVSGTGSAAMEAAIGSLLEPDETLLVRTGGFWGDRMAQMARRVGAAVVDLDVPANRPVDPDAVAAKFETHDIDVFGFCHADTTTGVRQPAVPELTAIARDHEAYTIMDCVTSLGGVEVRVDEWNVDIAYSAGQKCLSAPPGVSPITVSDRAVEKICSRETRRSSWYLDLELLWDYWGDDPQYHHTGPISAIYALREALRLVAEEGLKTRWKRHWRVAGELKAGLEELGLELNAPDEYWLPSLNAVKVPTGIDDRTVVSTLRSDYGIEIATGLGDLDGEIWRIGCMGHTARMQNVTYLLYALEAALRSQGHET